MVRCLGEFIQHLGSEMCGEICCDEHLTDAKLFGVCAWSIVFRLCTSCPNEQEFFYVIQELDRVVVRGGAADRGDTNRNNKAKDRVDFWASEAARCARRYDVSPAHRSTSSAPKFFRALSSLYHSDWYELGVRGLWW